MNALHIGVSEGHVEVVEELVSKADPSVINAVDKVHIAVNLKTWFLCLFHGLPVHV